MSKLHDNIEIVNPTKKEEQNKDTEIFLHYLCCEKK